MKKLNDKGFSHDLLAVLFVVIFAVAGVGYLVASHANPALNVPPPPPGPPTSSLPKTAALVNSASNAVAASAKGSIPVVKPYYTAKGLPAINKDGSIRNTSGAHASSNGIQYGTNYNYAGAYDLTAGVGISSLITVNHPRTAKAIGSHSLVELAATSADNKQAVEVGWTVDPIKYGNQTPHLFTYHWVNGKPSCYNACGWVQTSTKIKPGQALWPDGKLQRFEIYHFNGAWWIGYAGKGNWIGFYPDSLWKSAGVTTFNHFAITQIFGEVTDTKGTFCSQMGNGTFGSYGNAAQQVGSYYFGFGPSHWTHLQQFHTNGFWYNTGGPNAFGGIYIGGPGGRC